MTDWQLIKTAPRDGTRVLVYAERVVGEASYRLDEDEGGPDAWWWSRSGPGTSHLGDSPIHPSHWMPLPTPPTPPDSSPSPPAASPGLSG